MTTFAIAMPNASSLMTIYKTFLGGHFAGGFIAFRLFDILKPWPVSWADRSVAGAWGVMLDDLIAGAYAAGVVYVVGRIMAGGG